MLKKILIIAFIVVIMGPIGYFSERYILRPDLDLVNPAEEGTSESPNAILFKMPLGKLTARIVRRGHVQHLLIDIDLYILGSADFERMNGAMGRARLRDATIAVISELGNTTFWSFDYKSDEYDRRLLEEQIVRKLYVRFPMVRTARINELSVGASVR